MCYKFGQIYLFLTVRTDEFNPVNKKGQQLLPFFPVNFYSVISTRACKQQGL